jgi:hypothetical protein
VLTTAADVLFVALVRLATALPTGHLAAVERGWFPGGKDPKPQPDPKPEEGK